MENKKLIILLIIVLIFICISLITFMMSVINGNFRFKLWNWNNVSTELAIEEEYENTFKNININANAAEIYVKEGRADKVRVLIYGEKENINFEKTDEELKIDVNTKKKSFFIFGKEIYKIEIYIPEEYKEKLRINNDYGDVNIEKFLSSDIEIKENCGDVSVIGGKKVNIKNDYGDINLEEAEEANINQSAGDVKVGSVKDISVNNNYGDIKIRNVTNSLEIKEDCGDVKIDKITLNKNSTIKNNLGDIQIGSTNEIYIETKTNLGDTKVKNNYPKSDIKLKIENSCGDIKIDN